MTYTEISMLIRGKPGTPVHLKVMRAGTEASFTATRKQPQPVTSRMVGGDIAYIRQDDFLISAVPIFKEQMSDLLSQNPKGIIWDLRHNGGGALDSVLQILGSFMDNGLALCTQRQKDPVQCQNVITDSSTTNLPLVVLVGPNSYSAPEAASSTIQERKRGYLIGRPTYGKGTINQFFQFVDGAGLQLTTMHWITLSGEWLEGKGVTPDVCLDDDPATEHDEVLEYAIAHLQQQSTDIVGQECNP